MGGFNENFVGVIVIGSDGNSFVEELVELFDADSLVVAVCSDMNVNVQHGTDSVE
jgi:hypothetical protein